MMIAMLLACGSYAQTTFEYDGLKYKVLTGSTVEVSVIKESMPRGDVYVPSAVENDGQRYTVVAIGGMGFWNAKNMTSITLPPTVAKIDYAAFGLCDGLMNIYVEKGSENFISVDGILFSPDKRVLAAFPQGRGGSYTIPSTVREIGPHAFTYNRGLTSVTIPNSVTSIGNAAFNNCSSLTTLTIPGSVQKIGSTAFSSCSGLRQIIFEEGLTTIGWGAFKGCSSLSNIELPNSLRKIGDTAFGDCNALRTFTIPRNVTTIEYGILEDCESLEEIKVARGNMAFESKGGVLFTKGMDMLVQFPAGRTGKYKIPKSVHRIEAWAFCGTHLRDISIPKSVVKIGSFAFAYSKTLTSIEIPKSVTAIENYTFSSCKALTKCVIPKSVVEMGTGVFNNCPALTDLRLPDHIRDNEEIMRKIR